MTSRVWRRSLRVEVRHGLVHQQQPWVAHDRSAHRDALLLATRERARTTIEDVLELQGRSDLLDPTLHHGPLHVGETHRKADVPGNGQVRIRAAYCWNAMAMFRSCGSTRSRLA